MTRSSLLIAALAAVFALTAIDAAVAKPRRKPHVVRNQVVRAQPIVKISPVSTKEMVDFDEDFPRGTIVVKSAEKKLYYTLGDGRAVRYAIAVGQPRFQWSGDLWISRKAENPGWNPTPRMRRENPGLPKYVGPGPTQSAWAARHVPGLERIPDSRHQRAAFDRLGGLQRLLPDAQRGCDGPIPARAYRRAGARAALGEAPRFRPSRQACSAGLWAVR